MVMEYAKHGSMYDILKERGSLPEDEARRCVTWRGKGPAGAAGPRISDVFLRGTKGREVERGSPWRVLSCVSRAHAAVGDRKRRERGPTRLGACGGAGGWRRPAELQHRHALAFSCACTHDSIPRPLPGAATFSRCARRCSCCRSATSSTGISRCVDGHHNHHDARHSTHIPFACSLPCHVRSDAD
jgi:hypothetical protein